MTLNDVPKPSASHRSWWAAPLAMSVLGVPMLLWEYFLFMADDYPASIDGVIWLGLLLFLIAWAPPWRPSVQWLRMAVVTTAFVCAVFPLLLVGVVVGVAVGSG